MADDDSDLEKTEEPTDRRLREAVKKGQVIFSREVTNFLFFVLFALNIIWFAPYYTSQAVFDLSRFIHSAHHLRVDNEGGILDLSRDTLLSFAQLMAIPITGAVFVAIFGSVIQSGFNLSGEPVIPKLEKISILKGLKRMFSLRSLMEFIKGLIKITLVGVVAYMVVASEITRMEQIISYSVAGMMDVLGILAFKMVLAAACVMFIIAILDYLYQRFEYLKNLRMTRQELKEEFKQSEGNPEIKARLRQIRQERARKRMMAAVPQADVVIRNPTHYAIALEYDEATMSAPTVTALGQDNIALKIIEIAEEHDVPVITNRPLAKALFDSAELDAEIPIEHYQAVAEIISYIFQLKNKQRVI